MEFYLSFNELLGRGGNSLAIIFLPLFLVMTMLEGLIILYRQGDYPWKNAGVSLLVTVGHFITQAAVHGLIFGIIAAFVYKFRLTTIPVSFHNWISLIVLFLLVDLGFHVEHRSSHRIRFLWASHSVHHSSDKMQATTAFRLSWTPILSGVILFYLPIVWIGVHEELVAQAERHHAVHPDRVITERPDLEILRPRSSTLVGQSFCRCQRGFLADDQRRVRRRQRRQSTGAEFGPP
jgi:sterol desaturase/sphingolipid hydroxylase (fatty acid hydroxylase superfamily)